jgi:hypothetical protein
VGRCWPGSLGFARVTDVFLEPCPSRAEVRQWAANRRAVGGKCPSDRAMLVKSSQRRKRTEGRIHPGQKKGARRRVPNAVALRLLRNLGGIG